jgi:hypothetical protein
MNQAGDAADEAPELESRPWEEPGAIRRDWESHHGPLLVRLGLAGLFCAQIGWLVVPTLLALVLGVVVWVMAQRDLNKIRAGLMDPGGRSQVVNARICGISATLVAAFWAVALACLVYVLAGHD